MQPVIPNIDWTGRWSVFDHVKDKIPKEKEGSLYNLICELDPVGEEKDGKKITFATYKEKINRKKSNIRYLSGMILDFDYAKNELLADLQYILPFFHFAHNSFRDGTIKDEETGNMWRKFRVFIPFPRPIQVHEYEVLWNYMASLFTDSGRPDEDARMASAIFNTRRVGTAKDWMICSSSEKLIDLDLLPGGQSLKQLVAEENRRLEQEKAERERRRKETLANLENEPSQTAKENYAMAALKNCVAVLQNLPAGNRNRELNKESFAMGTLVGTGILGEQYVEETLIEAASQSGHSRDQVVATVKSGIKAGMNYPRDLSSVKESKKRSSGTNDSGQPQEEGQLDDQRPRYVHHPDGLYYDKFDTSKKKRIAWKLCSPLKVVALTRDQFSKNWGRLIELKDRDGNTHEWAMPMEYTATEGTEYRRILLNMGLEMASGKHNKELLHTYITTADVKRRCVCVNKVGWYKGQYVMQDSVIGDNSEEVLFQSVATSKTLTQEGDHKDWIKNIGKLCQGNSRLILSVCAGLAAPLLDIVKADSGGFHFRGGSSTGKSTCLRVASSVFGSEKFIRQWRTTDNGLEAIAAQQNDGLLILDEIGQVDPKVVGNIAYMLANGVSKTRANRSGIGTRDILHWRLIFLSSGEIGLSEHMDRSGQKSQAGMEVRLIEIPVDAGVEVNGVPYGAFENLHGCKSPSEFADLLKFRSGQTYGTLFPLWIKYLVENYQELFDLVTQSKADLIASIRPPEAEGQVMRALDRFAILAVAGEIATQAGLTGWEPGESTDAVQKCFASWLAKRGGVVNLEEINMLQQVTIFFQKHGTTRFSPEDYGDREIYNRAGFVRRNPGEGMTFYVYPEVFTKEICRGYNSRDVAKLLKDKKMIECDKQGRTSVLTRLPDDKIRKRRMYVFNSRVLGESVSDAEQETLLNAS